MAIEKITAAAHKLPLEVVKDINERIRDWLASGGSIDDPYIEQQWRFASRFLKE